MREIFKNHWPVLLADPILEKYLTPHPSITARQAKNLKDHLVRSHYQTNQGRIFGTKGPKWGCSPCGRCVACPNIERATDFYDSVGKSKYIITQSITCNTKAVIYYATCPCPKIYVGLTSRELKVRVREHIRDIIAAKNTTDDRDLKPISKHFRLFHNSDSQPPKSQRN